MLVDLGRNDVGKVADWGSVSVDRLMDVERYSHVMHISSTVTGKLREGLTCWDALRAALPAGTISGAPKVGGVCCCVVAVFQLFRRFGHGGCCAGVCHIYVPHILWAVFVDLTVHTIHHE